MYCIGISICISVCTVYGYLVSRYVYSVSKYIQIQSAGAGHDEHAQKGATRAQKAARRDLRGKG